MTAKFIWPRSYLLEIYDEAIKQGFLILEGIESEEQALSLKNTLYRLRRRSDKSNVAYITPDHHLVTVGQYDEVAKTLPIIFNKVPDTAAPLPSFRKATPEEVAAWEASQPVVSIPDSLPSLDSSGVDDYVTRMLANSKKEQ